MLLFANLCEVSDGFYGKWRPADVLFRKKEELTSVHSFFQEGGGAHHGFIVVFVCK